MNLVFAKVLVSKQVIKKILAVVELRFIKTLFSLFNVVSDKNSNNLAVLARVSLTCGEADSVEPRCECSDRVSSFLYQFNEDSS